MASYIELYQLRDDATFQRRVEFARFYLANYIRNEDPQTPNHESRYAWALNCLNGQLSMPVAQVALLACLDPAVRQDGAAVTDAALQTAVEYLIDVMIARG